MTFEQQLIAVVLFVAAALMAVAVAFLDLVRQAPPDDAAWRCDRGSQLYYQEEADNERAVLDALAGLANDADLAALLAAQGVDVRGGVTIDWRADGVPVVTVRKAEG